MKNKFFLLSLAALIFAGCSDDSSSAGLKTTCGDGELNDGEICDGTLFAEGVKVCPAGLIPKDESAFACTKTCSLDITNACAAPTCGDNELTAGEICDGDKFRDGVKVCPFGMEEVDSPEWGCTNTCLLDITKACKLPENNNTNTNTNTCQETCNNDELDEGEVCDGDKFAAGVKKCPDGMVELQNPVYSCNQQCGLDISKACVPSICGDGKLTGDEVCDGDLFADGVKVCPAGQKSLTGRDLFKCNACTLETQDACIANDANEPALYISEIRMIANNDNTAVNHLYIEIGNIGEETSLSDCKLIGFNQDATDNARIDKNFVFEQSLSDAAERLGNSVSEPKNVIGICYQPTNGWIKTQYDKDTKTLEECNLYYGGIDSSRYQCNNECYERNASDECEQACEAAYNTLMEVYNDMFKKASFRNLDENCDLYLPSSINSLNMTLSDVGQYVAGTSHTNNLWGIGVMCGENIYDLIKLDGLNSYGGARMCTKTTGTLADIETTGEMIYNTSYQENQNAMSYQLSKVDQKETYGLAECGRVEIF